ncbi:MAG: hypothetical protein GF383_07965 [Candidatus Lokiarchaeota archaeon]|nr:hypothetical protein [Candidatus Lokiarchaeota archaeon]
MILFDKIDKNNERCVIKHKVLEKAELVYPSRSQICKSYLSEFLIYTE